MTTVRAVAPGRVNLIGEHVDYVGGLVLPMAVDRATTVEGAPDGGWVRLVSESASEPAEVPLDIDDPAAVEPPWARYVAGVVAELRPERGFDGRVTSTIPVGGGMSSSAALEVAVALALGFTGSATDLALLCQRAEQRASGVPCGVMDQLASAAGVEGHALLIDCATLEVEPVPLPEDLAVVVVDSGQPRRLAASGYAERRAQAEAAQRALGPLRAASVADAEALEDGVLARRARHVITECARVLDFVAALRAGDLARAGALLTASHVSLRDDAEVSTPELDALVDQLTATPGVLGARLMGGGFGGCVVALAEPGAAVAGWAVRAAVGARRDER